MKDKTYDKIIIATMGIMVLTAVVYGVITFYPTQAVEFECRDGITFKDDKMIVNLTEWVEEPCEVKIVVLTGAKNGKHNNN